MVGDVVIPASHILLCVCSGSYYDNFTGLRTDSVFGIWFYITAICTAAYLFYALHTLGRQTIRKNELPILLLIMTVSLFMPYRSAGDLVSNIHIILAYAAFLYMNILLARIVDFNRRIISIYVCLLIPCILLIITAMSITGLSETIYVCGVSIILTQLLVKNSQ